jgi:hypothetical protein
VSNDVLEMLHGTNLFVLNFLCGSEWGWVEQSCEWGCVGWIYWPEKKMLLSPANAARIRHVMIV